MNTTQFLAAVKRAISVPTFQPRFTESDLLEIAYEEQKSTVVPYLHALSQGYMMVREREAVLADVASVRFPYRAIGRSIANVFWEAETYASVELRRISLKQANNWRDDDTGTPSAFSELGDRILLRPMTDTAGSLLWHYARKPSKLVAATRGGTVTAVGTDTLTVGSTVPSVITVGSLCDVTRAKPGYECLYTDLTVTGASGGIITFSGFATTPIADVSVGDVVTLAEETTLLQLPDEVHDWLVHATAVRVLESLGIPDQLKIAQEQLQRKKEAVMLLLAPRVEDQPDIIFSGHPLIGGGFSRRSLNTTVS